MKVADAKHANSAEAGNAGMYFSSIITKSEVRAMLENPGVINRAIVSNIQGMVELYGYDAVAKRSIATVLVKQASKSIELEKKTGRPNGIVESFVGLYLSSEITSLCQDAVLLDAGSIIYAVEQLHEAMGHDRNLTLKMIRLLNGGNSREELGLMAFMMKMVSNAVEASPNSDRWEAAEMELERLMEFKETYSRLSKA